MFRHLPMLISATLLLQVAQADNWLQLRGDKSHGVATGIDLPDEWDGPSGKNIAWKTALPGQGPSSPIVVGDHVFVTASGGRNDSDLFILAVNTKSGKEAWRRTFKATGRTLTHETSAVAAPSPVSNGEVIVAFYSSNDLICVDLEGNLRWFRGIGSDYPKVGNDIGMASSPVIVGNTVVVQAESQGDSFAVGINLDTGENRWKIPRKRQANWASPAVFHPEDESPMVMLQSGDRITTHNAMSGEIVWEHIAECDRIASPLANGNQIVVPTGGLSVLQVEADNPEPEVAWESGKLAPGSSSPIINGGQVFVVDRAGILKCANLEDGKVAWKLRMGVGRQWSTPVISGNRLYSFGTNGKAAVVDLSGGGELVSVSNLDDTIKGSPAIAENAIYVRSDNTLWKIAKP